MSIEEVAVFVSDEARTVLMQCAMLTDLEATAVALALFDAPFGASLTRPGLTFGKAIDHRARFCRSSNVAAYSELTSKRWQSGTSTAIQNRISLGNDPDVRRSLYETASPSSHDRFPQIRGAGMAV